MYITYILYYNIYMMFTGSGRMDSTEYRGGGKFQTSLR